jgi:hypothetical protein
VEKGRDASLDIIFSANLNGGYFEETHDVCNTFDGSAIGQKSREPYSRMELVLPSHQASVLLCLWLKATPDM